MTKKQKDILKAGRALLFKYGIRKVSVEDVCKEADVSKMTFYKYYPNKIALVKAVVDELLAYWMGRYKAMLQSGLSAEEKMQKLLEYKIETAREMDMAFFVDLYRYPDDELKTYLNTWTKIRFDLATDWFHQMQAEGQISKDVHLSVFLLFASAIQDFALKDEVIRLFPDTKELTKVISSLFLYGVAGK